jgi:hypothetical protein
MSAAHTGVRMTVANPEDIMSEDLRQGLAGRAACQCGRFQLQLLGDFSLRRRQTHVALSMGSQRLLAFLAPRSYQPSLLHRQPHETQKPDGGLRRRYCFIPPRPLLFNNLTTQADNPPRRPQHDQASPTTVLG